MKDLPKYRLYPQEPAINYHIEGEYLTKFLRLFNETLDYFDRIETILDDGGAVFSFTIEDIRSHDSSEVVKIHFTATFFIDMGKRSHPR